MFLFKKQTNKCIKCKYNISLRVNFYYRFLLKFKNAVNTFEILYAHFFSLLGLLCFSSSKMLLSLYIKLISKSFSCRACLSASLSLYNGCHIIINVSRSKCEYFFLFSYLFWKLVLSWNVYCWSSGWMCGGRCVQSYVKPGLLLPHESICYLSLWTISPRYLLKQRYFSTSLSSCSSLYIMLYNTLFSKSCLKIDTSCIHYVQ